LQYAILGEFARVGPDGLATIVGAGFDRISVPALPAQHLIGFALRVLLEQNEKDATVAVTLRPPSGYQLGFESSLTVAPDARPYQGHFGVPLAVNLTAPLTVEGLYRLSVAVNGEEQQELTFEVEVQQPTQRASN